MPAAARALMLERAHEQDCQLARSVLIPGGAQDREQLEWRWLPPERAQAEREAVQAAAQRLLAGCLPPAVDDAERQRRGAEAQVRLQAAVDAGDLYARLEARVPAPLTPALAAQLRATLYDAVLSGDPDAIRRIWRLHEMIDRGRPLVLREFVNSADLWPLIACDLGMDCGPQSRALDRACFGYESGCGYASLEVLIRERTPAWQYRLLDQRRRELVERIRSGQIAGMFDPRAPIRNPGGG
jgi:hypothetical protein